MRFTRCLSVALIIAGIVAAMLWRQLPHDDAARMQPGAIEIGFAQSMSRHHAQAIAMSQLMQDGRPSRLSLLARSVEGAQQLELGEMRGWLRLWQLPLEATNRSMDWMLAGDAAPDEELRRYLLDCQRSPTGMPGLASTDDLERLRSLDGDRRDRHFLQLLLAHHRGALPMARFAAEQAQVPAVRELATRVVLEQAREIERIQLMLQALLTARP
ncbi:DUF305 domain-containing protein [Nevskia sp.]|uniref:DUF305 domain-containing protein n=1 Tax=Nevskia sp. TaxID=1929292 RepID=UPI0025DA695E|nr:DUF305 domain-containing protein [Nevskia sp.]